MSFWSACFGNAMEVFDCSGRKIAQLPYSLKNNELGWVIVPILPLKQGGSLTYNNLMICHIKTAEEKGDNYPYFTANGRSFTIKLEKGLYVVEEDRYEVTEKTVEWDKAKSGLAHFADCKENCEGIRRVGIASLRIKNPYSVALIDFMEDIFLHEDISYTLERRGNSRVYKLIIKDHDMLLQSDYRNLFQDCLIAEHYLRYYFYPLGYLESYDIGLRLYEYGGKEELCRYDKEDMAQDVRGATFVNGLLINKNFAKRLGDTPGLKFEGDAQWAVCEAAITDLANDLYEEAKKVYAKKGK